MKLFRYVATLGLLAMSQAYAGDILFINYNGSDKDIATVLNGDGHAVTSVDVPPDTASTYFQNAPLDQYCAVVWSAAYAYNEDVDGAVTSLSDWADAGGHVLITTPDAIRNDADLLALVGGSSGTDSGNNYSTVANIVNSVTTGLFDIRGQQPSDISDEDSLCGPLLEGTVGLVTATSGCPEEPGYTWTLRSIGAGQAAFITSGNFSGTGTNDPDWTSTSIPGNGVYNAGLRNFAYTACSPAAAAAIPATSTLGLFVASILLSIVGAIKLGRRRKNIT